MDSWIIVKKINRFGRKIIFHTMMELEHSRCWKIDNLWNEHLERWKKFLWIKFYSLKVFQAYFFDAIVAFSFLYANMLEKNVEENVIEHRWNITKRTYRRNIWHEMNINKNMHENCSPHLWFTPLQVEGDRGMEREKIHCIDNVLQFVEQFLLHSWVVLTSSIVSFN